MNYKNVRLIVGLMGSLVSLSAHGMQNSQNSTQAQECTAQLLTLCKQENPENAVERAKQLLAQGALFGKPDEQGVTAFEWTILKGHRDLCKLFFDEVENNALLDESTQNAYHAIRQFKTIEDIVLDCVQEIYQSRTSLIKKMVLIQSVKERVRSLDRDTHPNARNLCEGLMLPFRREVVLSKALRFAVSHNKPDLVKYLMEHLSNSGISLRGVFEDLILDQTFLQKIETASGEEIIQLLKEAGASQGVLSPMPWHRKINAEQRSSCSSTQEKDESKVIENTKAPQQETPTNNNRSEIQDENGFMPIQRALLDGDVEQCRLLMRNSPFACLEKYIPDFLKALSFFDVTIQIDVLANTLENYFNKGCFPHLEVAHLSSDELIKTLALLEPLMCYFDRRLSY